MKKILKVIALAIVMTTLLPIAGCDASVEANVAEEYYTLANFETIDGLRGFHYLNNFGKISLNKETEYIMSGECSARLEIYGEPSSGGCVYPAMWIRSYEKTDFTDVDYFVVDFYNNGQTDVDVTFSYGYEVNKDGPFASQTTTTLVAGEWTHMIVPLAREAAILAYDISKVNTFMFTFPNRAEGDEPAVIYMDNFLAHKAKTEMGTFTKIREKNEIAYFEDISDAQAFRCYGVYQHYVGMPSLSLNVDKRYIKQGKASLRIESKETPYRPMTNGVMDSVHLAYESTFMEGIEDFSQYEAIEISVYNASNRDWNWQLTLATVDTPFYKNVRLNAGEWTIITITIDEMQQVLDTTAIVEFRISYNLFHEGTPLVFYLDNVRFIQKGVTQ